MENIEVEVRRIGTEYIAILERYDERRLTPLNGDFGDEMLIMRDKNDDEIIINKRLIDSITNYMDIETVYQIYAEANIWLDKVGSIIEPNEYYELGDDKLVYFCEDTNICKILEIQENEDNFFIVYDVDDEYVYDKYQIIYKPNKNKSFSIEVNLPFQAKSREYYAITNEDKILGPGNQLEIMDALYYSP